MTSAQPMRVGAGGIPPSPFRAQSIVDRRKPYPLAVAGPGDFTCGDESPADPGDVLHDPDVSLYCLDHANRRALFVRTTPGVDLTAQPFYFQAQFEHATDVIAVPYEVLHELAARAEFDPDRLVLLYSTGRCGSTLVVHAMAALGGLTALSEPDVLTQLVMLGEHEPERDRLAVSCLRLLCTKYGPIALKPRSFAIELAASLAREVPDARMVFLYRDPVSWARSATRAFSGYDPAIPTDPARVQDRLGLLIPLLAAHRARKGRLLTPAEMLACQWVSQVERALALHHRGTRLFTARYEDIGHDPHAVLGELFAFCGLPAPTELDKLLTRDSQAGTTLAREHTSESTDGLDEAEFTGAVAELWGQIL